MAYRERSRSSGVNNLGYSATRTYWDDYPFTPPLFLPKVKQYMADYTSPKPYPDHPWSTIIHSVDLPPRIDGETPYWMWWRYKYVNYCPQNWGNPDPYYLPGPSVNIPTGILLTKAIASINPNNPKVDLPLLAFELKDFPSMLRNLGDILRKARNARDFVYGYLAYQFGWAPLISDLKTLVAFGSIIDARVKHIDKLMKGSTFSGSLGTADYVHDSGSPWTFGVTPADFLVGGLIITERHEYWYSAKASSSVQFLNQETARWEATKAALGLNVSAATLWNVIPWSFIVDYFFNIGEFLDAGRNGIPFQINSLCLMGKRTYKREVTPGPRVAGVTLTGGSSSVTAKSRYVPSLAIPVVAPRPFLTGQQLTNIGALVTAAALRRHR